MLTKFVKPGWDYEEIVFCGLGTFLIIIFLYPITLTLLYMNKKLWLQIPLIGQKIKQIFFLWHAFQGSYAKLSLYVHILVIADNTKVLQAFCFLRLPYPRCVQWCPDTSWCCPHTLWVLLCICSALVSNWIVSPLQSPKLAGHGPKVCLGIIHLFGGKKRWIGQRADKGKNNNSHHHDVHIYCRTLGHFNTSPSNN